MQSYVAYKRFCRHVTEQYERDKLRAEVLGRRKYDELEPQGGNGAVDYRAPSVEETESSSATNKSIDERPDSRDLEKAEGLPRDHVLDKFEDDQAKEGVPAWQIPTAQSLSTQQSFGTRLGQILSGIEVRQVTRQLRSTRIEPSHVSSGEKRTVLVVTFESEKDSMNPHNWPQAKKWSATALISLICFTVGFASSVDSAAITEAATDFGISVVTESLATGLFLIGFGVGSLFAGPVSETVNIFYLLEAQY